jgi:hypothetical protein
MRSPEVTELQRELCKILHRGWCTANQHRRMRDIRDRIYALDPDACLYLSWGGPSPRHLERRFDEDQNS